MGKVKKKLTSLLKAMNNYRVLICLQRQGALLFFFFRERFYIKDSETENCISDDRRFATLID